MYKKEVIIAVVGQIVNMYDVAICDRDYYGNTEPFEGWCEGGEVFHDGFEDEEDEKSAIALMKELAPLVDDLTNGIEKHIDWYEK